MNKHNYGVDSQINLIFLFCCFSEVICILHKHLLPEYHYVLLSVEKKIRYKELLKISVVTEILNKIRRVDL